MAGKVDPVFVDDIAMLPQAILDHARAGDVLVSMGAGSIGQVPGLVLELKQRADALAAANATANATATLEAAR